MVEKDKEKTPRDQYHEVITEGQLMRQDALHRMQKEDIKKSILMEIKNLAQAFGNLNTMPSPEESYVLIKKLESLSKKLEVINEAETKALK
ncbi:hypothetical protein HYW46_06965 [Candidatus Daviesbacteria bacterium]|nr:hypothetical protein [Candidatus Daviesbacteria bacterium]